MEIRVNPDGTISVLLRAEAQNAGIASAQLVEFQRLDQERVQEIYRSLDVIYGAKPARSGLVTPDFLFGPADG